MVEDFGPSAFLIQAVVPGIGVGNILDGELRAIGRVLEGLEIHRVGRLSPLQLRYDGRTVGVQEQHVKAVLDPLGAQTHEDRAPLFPFDPEVKYLSHDIDLVGFLARKVLIASSRPYRSDAWSA